LAQTYFIFFPFFLSSEVEYLQQGVREIIKYITNNNNNKPVSGVVESIDYEISEPK
jgi:hypothetical protein